MSYMSHICMYYLDSKCKHNSARWGESNVQNTSKQDIAPKNINKILSQCCLLVSANKMVCFVPHKWPWFHGRKSLIVTLYITFKSLLLVNDVTPIEYFYMIWVKAFQGPNYSQCSPRFMWPYGITRTQWIKCVQDLYAFCLPGQCHTTSPLSTLRVANSPWDQLLNWKGIMYSKKN